MLWHLAEQSSRSGKRLKILVMVSDGLPVECSWDSLHELVCKLEDENFVCVQVAVDEIENPAFERFFIDLTKCTMDEAVVEFGQMLLLLLTTGRPV